MATTTALQESSQALFCAIADLLGKNKSNNELTLTKYPTYQDFKLKNQSIIKKALLEITVKEKGSIVKLSEMEKFLTSNGKAVFNKSTNDWYKSSVQIANKIINDLTKIDPQFGIASPNFQNLYYFRGDVEVMGYLEELFKLANKSPATVVKFGNVNKWNPADIYFASEKAKKDIAKELYEARPTKSYTFSKLNIFTSNLIDSGDLLPLSLKKTTTDVKLVKVNFDKKAELKKMKDVSVSPKGVSDWKPYKKVKFGQKTETRDLKIYLNLPGGMIKIRHSPADPKFVAEFVLQSAEARGGCIGSIGQFCEMFNFVDRVTSQRLLNEYREGEKKFKVALTKIEWLRKTDKNRYDFERGALSGLHVINKIMPILKPWFKRTTLQGKRQVDDFIKILYSYVTSRSKLSGQFVIAK